MTIGSTVVLAHDHSIRGVVEDIAGGTVRVCLTDSRKVVNLASNHVCLAPQRRPPNAHRHRKHRRSAKAPNRTHPRSVQIDAIIEATHPKASGRALWTFEQVGHPGHEPEYHFHRWRCVAAEPAIRWMRGRTNVNACLNEAENCGFSCNFLDALEGQKIDL